MKQNNLKKSAHRAQKILSKPSAKGVILKSAKNENSNIKIRNTKQIQNPEIQNKKQSFRSFEFNKFDIVSNFVLRASNLKHWHKISAAFVSIAIIGIVVFFQFAPEKATRGTFEPFVL